MRLVKSSNIFIICLVLLSALTANPALAKDVFTVDNIPVEKSASDATEAKNMAIDEAEKLAFDKLIKSVVNEADLARIPSLSEEEISSLVKGFEVSDEKLSGNKYQANFTILFLENNVKKLLLDADIVFVDNKGAPTLVFPLYKEGINGKTVWQSSTPWWKAWDKTITEGSVVPLVLPLGDIDDLEMLDGAEISSADYVALEGLAKKYEAKDILIAEAVYDGTAFNGKPSINVTFRMLDKNGNKESQSVQIDGDYEQEIEKLFKTAVSGVTSRMGTELKKQKIVEEAEAEKVPEKPNVVVNVPISGLGDWLKMKGRIEKIKSIDNFEVITLSPALARLRIFYKEDIETFINFLGTEGFNLHKGKDGQSWVMEANG